MWLEYLAHSCFLMTAENGYRVMIDPYDRDLGYKPIQRKTDVILVSHQHPDHSNIGGIPGNTKIFSSSGSFKTDNVQVKGMVGKHGGSSNSGFTLVFSIIMDGIKFSHLGDLGEVPQGPMLDFLEGTQVMMLPVGGTYTLDPVRAKEVIEIIRPSIAIPMHYMTASLDKTRYPLGPVEDFTALFAKTRIIRESSMEITGDNLPDTTEIVIMNYTY
ncbi:MAG: MBL fold metallo-hydrolase [Candidatus Eremiobacteraeota bacterium]|nr:MBL fold metallo-hydrolase [Candidatus Eremiobacteraeota bacterium]